MRTSTQREMESQVADYWSNIPRNCILFSGIFKTPLILIFLLLRSEYVIIFSHGNSTDIGRMIESLLDLAYNLKVNLARNFPNF